MSDNFYINSFFFFFSLFFFSFIGLCTAISMVLTATVGWLVDCLSIYSFVFFRRQSVEMVEFRKSTLFQFHY